MQAKPSGSIAAPRILAAALAGWVAAAPAAARADDASRGQGIVDGVLEKLQLKARPADPPPDFVRQTRPDAAGLDYIQRPTPHKVSPIPTKSADEVQAMKDALDAARERQLNPPPPVAIGPAPAAAKRAAKKKPPN